jgi:hypothetical protein
MPSPFHTNNNTIIVEDYDNALDIIKQKLYDGEIRFQMQLRKCSIVSKY